jgi:hypothetical protein
MLYKFLIAPCVLHVSAIWCLLIYSSQQYASLNCYGFKYLARYLAQCPVIDSIITGPTQWDPYFYSVDDGQCPECWSTLLPRPCSGRPGVNGRMKLLWSLEKSGRMSSGYMWFTLESSRRLWGKAYETLDFIRHFLSNEPADTFKVQYLSHGCLTCDPPDCYAARGHICKLCTYYNQLHNKFRLLDTAHNVSFARAAREPDHNNCCDPLPKEAECPCFKRMYAYSFL